MHLRLDDLHPSQEKVGRATVIRRLKKTISDLKHLSGPELEDYLAQIQSQLSTLNLPCTLMPDGLCWISDGHHRATLIAWIEVLREIRGKFSICVELVDNLSRHSWKDAIRRMIETKRMYLEPTPLSRIESLLASSPEDTLDETDWLLLIREMIPEKFHEISDDPTRAAVGELLEGILEQIPTVPFTEFYVGKIIDQKLAIKDISKATEPCARKFFSKDCRKFKKPYLKQIADLIALDPEVQDKIIESVEEGSCVSKHGQAINCKDLVRKRLKKSASISLQTS